MNPIEQLIDKYRGKMTSLSAAEWLHRSAPGKWSKKEILGHLIDSAMNNQRRFVVAQYQRNQKIVYKQDLWVKFQQYQIAPVGELIELWLLLNKQLIRTVQAMEEDSLEKTCDTGIEKQELHTIRFLIDDYVVHMQHHLAQIFIQK